MRCFKTLDSGSVLQRCPSALRFLAAGPRGGGGRANRIGGTCGGGGRANRTGGGGGGGGIDMAAVAAAVAAVLTSSLQWAKNIRSG